MKKNSSIDPMAEDRFFPMPAHLASILGQCRLPFPVYTRETEHWTRVGEAGTLWAPHVFESPLYVQSTERMSWSSVLLSLLEAPQTNTTLTECAHIIAESGVHIFRGWTGEPTRHGYLGLAHRWASNVLTHVSNPDVTLSPYLTRDVTPAAHSVRCAAILAQISRVMPWSPPVRRWTVVMGLIHNLGHAVVDDDAPEQQGEAGIALLSSHGDLPEFVYYGVKQHHERFDGTGHPYGLSGQQLGWAARLLSIVTHWDHHHPIVGSTDDLQTHWERFLESHGHAHDPEWLETISTALHFDG